MAWQEVSRHYAFNPGVTAGQPDVIPSGQTTSSVGEVGSRHRMGGLSDAAGEAEPQRGRGFAGRLNQPRGERSTLRGRSHIA